MPTPVGVAGSFTPPTGHKAKFDRWELNIGQRLVNTTGFTSGGYEENTGGLKFGTWTATGHFLADVAASSPGIDAISGEAAEAVFQVATGCTIAVDVVVANIASMSDVNNEARVTFTGVTSGAAVETWDETAGSGGA